MTLVEFLTARLDEDEATARDERVEDIPGDCWGPKRILREVEAKRRIVTQIHRRVGDSPDVPYAAAWQQDACEGCRWGGPTDDWHVDHVNDCPTLRALAAAYFDHPDYDEAWRP